MVMEGETLGGQNWTTAFDGFYVREAPGAQWDILLTGAGDTCGGRDGPRGEPGIRGHPCPPGPHPQASRRGEPRASGRDHGPGRAGRWGPLALRAAPREHRGARYRNERGIPRRSQQGAAAGHGPRQPCTHRRRAHPHGGHGRPGHDGGGLGNLNRAEVPARRVLRVGRDRGALCRRCRLRRHLHLSSARGRPGPLRRRERSDGDRATGGHPGGPHPSQGGRGTDVGRIEPDAGYG